MKKFAFTLMMLITSLNLFAQNNDIEMADALRSNGKIYIVVICVVIILVGLLIYLFTLDRRLKMLEKKILTKTNFKPHRPNLLGLLLWCLSYTKQNFTCINGLF